MPNKPARFGIKYFGIVDVDSNYLISCSAYVGKSDDDSVRATSVGYSVVNQLSSLYYGMNRCMTVDNWFTSIPLAIHLKRNKMDLVGTIRKNKVTIFFTYNRYKFTSNIFT